MRDTAGVHSFPQPHSGSDTLQNQSTSEILKSNIPRFYSLLTLIFPFFPLLPLNCNKPPKPLTTVHIMHDKIQDQTEGEQWNGREFSPNERMQRWFQTSPEECHEQPKLRERELQEKAGPRRSRKRLELEPFPLRMVEKLRLKRGIPLNAPGQPRQVGRVMGKDYSHLRGARAGRESCTKGLKWLSD